MNVAVQHYVVHKKRIMLDEDDNEVVVARPTFTITLPLISMQALPLTEAEERFEEMRRQGKRLRVPVRYVRPDYSESGKVGTAPPGSGSGHLPQRPWLEPHNLKG